ncbi:transposase [Rhodopseudomonas rhenobacensis]|uniref:Transposase n=1 Tax=Rhodopseudomonas rhenobacensis TaxID=87461 RepID=A0A7W7Z8P2_9BRAD|nr:transposase [Rhodopseudomonas rhenobacensis]MBB5049949.1 transposase [Rhodopseudomonas rhenobacensis]
MDSHKCSTQVERLEVVETGRRRQWTDDEKLKIVLESMQAPRTISSTARRHGISRSLLLTWRRSFGAVRAGEVEQPKPAFVPAVVTSTAAPANAPSSAATPASGRMMIELGEQRRVIVDAGVDADALARVLAVLERR